MDIEEHIKEYKKIVQKYQLDKDEKASEIADFLTNPKREKVSAEEFSTLFGMSLQDAVVFLSFIKKGLEFKRHLGQR